MRCSRRWSALVGNVLGDTSVQDAVGGKVGVGVGSARWWGVGDTVGAQVGAAVVGLITNPFIGNGLVSLVDAIAGGLFGSQDVVDAWADAAGRLAKAALVGDLSSVLPEVIADLRSNSVVDAAIESTVTDAIETLFGDTGLWDALQSAVVSLVGNVLGYLGAGCGWRQGRGGWCRVCSVVGRWGHRRCSGRCGGGRVDSPIRSLAMVW